jgi:ABC-type transport system substrate-binding protein
VSTSCFNDSDFDRFYCDQMSEAEAERFREHVSSCSECAARNVKYEAWEEMLKEVGREQATVSTSGSRPAIEIPGYRVLGEMGQGGQAIVYQAIKLTTRAKVAVKVMRREADTSRFHREIDVVAGLQHPNIISILDSGRTHCGQPFYAMEYIRGLPLIAYLRHRRGRVGDALQLFIKLCSAVQFAHQHGVIHRDLKPGNILVDVFGVPRIVDFGLAKCFPANDGQTATGSFLGTPAYTSPEAASGIMGDVDSRADVYGLGITLYEALAGDTPYPVKDTRLSAHQILGIVAQTPPKPLREAWRPDSGAIGRPGSSGPHSRCPIDHTLQAIVLKTLEKDPDKRYQAARDLEQDLRHYVAGDPIELDHGPVGFAIRRVWAAHRRKILGVAAGLIVAVTLWQGLATARRARDAGRARELVADARQLVERGTDFQAARQRLDEALELDPTHHRAVTMKALSEVLECRQLPPQERAAELHRALDLLGQAHELAGGNWPRESLPLSGDPATGSREALLYGAYVQQLLRDNDAALRLITLADRTRADPEHEPLLNVLYDPAKDTLIKRPPEDGPSGHLPPDRDATIHRTLRQQPRTYSPMIHMGPNEVAVAELIYDTLYYVAEDMQPAWNPIMLREAPRHENRITTLHLREGLEWHNGLSLTAEDVSYSWRKLLPQAHRRSIDALVSVDAVSDHEVRIQHADEVAESGWDLIFPIVPRQRMREIQSTYPDTPPTELHMQYYGHPIGNGPYRWAPDPEDAGVIRLERWDDYPGRDVSGLSPDRFPYFREVMFHVITDHRKRAMALAAGDVAESTLSSTAFWWDVTGPSFKERVNKTTHPGQTYEFICWNLRPERAMPFEDVRARRAMTMAIDIPTLIERWYAGLRDPWHGLYVDYPWVVRSGGGQVEPLLHAPIEAATLLDEAGWLMGPDGIRTRRGVAFEFDLLASQSSVQGRLTMMNIAQSLQNIGIVMHLDLEPPKRYLERLRSGDFDACFAATSNPRDPQQSSGRWTRQARRNYGRYHNPIVDELFERARHAPVADQGALYAEISTRIYDDQPCLFLWYKPTLWAVDKNLRGVQVRRSGLTGFLPGARGWWIPK